MKDTTANIKSENGFTVNIISEAFAEQANSCSIDAPEHISEWLISGLTKEPSVRGLVRVRHHDGPNLMHVTDPCKSSSGERECL
jgi:flavin reductase (DIM6/NTAB) family NADH-FMN oxidoreductase RutF